jgi:hypothetical protein
MRKLNSFSHPTKDMVNSSSYPTKDVAQINAIKSEILRLQLEVKIHTQAPVFRCTLLEII